MQITFTRSGGFAGMATNVEGTVKFDATGAHITSTRGAYHRDIDLSEAKNLIKAIESSLSSPPDPSAPNQTRDAFQYDVTVTTLDGKIHTLNFGQGISQASAALIKWIKDEINKIWAAQ